MDVTVVTSGHDVADARIHRLVAAMQNEGLEVEVLGLGRASDGPLGAHTSTRPRPGMVGRALLAVSYARRARGRVLFAVDPDSAVAAFVAARLRRRRVVVDVHEDYGALLTDRSWASGVLGRAARGLVAVADLVATRADLTLVADDHVPPHRARRRLVVRNEPDLGMLPAPQAFRPAAAPRAVYVGDVRPSRGLRAMVEATRRAPQWSLDLVGPVGSRDQEWLDRIVTDDPSLADRIRVHGRRPPSESWEVAREAWVGLALLEDTPAFRAAMPTKVLEFVACGLPVVTTDLPRPAALVRDNGAGAVVPVGSPETVGAAVAEILSALESDPALLAGWRRNTAELAARRTAVSPYRQAARAVGSLLLPRPQG